MKKLIALAAAVMITGQACASDNDRYSRFTDELAQEAIDIVMAKTDTDTKIGKFTVLFKDAAALDAIGKFVVGRYWRGASEEQRREFLDTFTDAIIMSWASKFNTFKGGKLKISTITVDEKSKDIFVNSVMRFNDDGSDAKVIWRLRDTKAGIKVFDIIIEGISMVMSYRNEYAAVLQKNDGDLSALTGSLRQKTENLKESFDK